MCCSQPACTFLESDGCFHFFPAIRETGQRFSSPRLSRSPWPGDVWRQCPAGGGRLWHMRSTWLYEQASMPRRAGTRGRCVLVLKFEVCPYSNAATVLRETSVAYFENRTTISADSDMLAEMATYSLASMRSKLWTAAAWSTYVAEQNRYTIRTWCRQSSEEMNTCPP